MKPNIELHIEELVLMGVDRNDSFLVARAVQERLEYLLRAYGLPQKLAAGAQIRVLRPVSAAAVPGASCPEHLGSSVAQAVYSGFTQNRTNASHPSTNA
jgi:hypothetical protein